MPRLPQFGKEKPGMSFYRMYWVGSDDHFKMAQDIECASDDEVLARAETMMGRHAAMEVWETGRFVGRVGAPPHPHKEA
jgi:hypothetical protein